MPGFLRRWSFPLPIWGWSKMGRPGGGKFLDTSICQITPRYIGMISQYQRILLQRNTLLKDISYAPSLMDTLDIWDEKLSALGGAIIRMRMEYTRRLQKQAADIYNGISMDRESFALSYRPFGLEEIQEGWTQKRSLPCFGKKTGRNRADDLRSGRLELALTEMIWKLPSTGGASGPLVPRGSSVVRCWP